MKCQRKVKSKVFTVDCERNDAYESDLKNHSVAYEYHGYDFYVPVTVDVLELTNFILGNLKKLGIPLVSITADRVFMSTIQSVWSADQIAHSLKSGYHR